LNGIQFYNIARLVPFQGATTADWAFTFAVNFDGSLPPLYYLSRKGDSVFSAVGSIEYGADKTPNGYDTAGNFLSVNTDGSIELIESGDVPDKAWPIAAYLRGGTTTTFLSYYSGVESINYAYQAWFYDADAIGQDLNAAWFNQIASGYNVTATIGYDINSVPVGVMAFNNLGESNFGANSAIIGSQALGSSEAFGATGICCVESWDAFNTPVDRLDIDGTVLAASVPNTGFAITSRRGVDYWRPSHGNPVGTNWYEYDEANPPTRGICLTDWRLMAGQVMTPNTAGVGLTFPVTDFDFWTGDGADCSCYSPIFTGWRTNGTGEAIYCANNVVIDGGSTTWNGARANDFRGIYKLNLDGTAASPFAVHLTFTGVDPNTNLADSFFNHATLLLADPAGLIWFTGPVTSINGRTVQPWQLYKIASDGSGGTQVGSFGGGRIWSMKYFGAEQYIVGGEFTSYIDGNGNNTGANFLLFMDGTGSQISLTW
jgi:hypothetical protein